MDRRDEAADALLEIMRRDRKLERGGGATAAPQVLRGLGLRGPGDDGGTAEAFGAAVQLSAPFHPRSEDLPASFPVFPLRGALVLPGGKLPLNIFEPRYLAMVEDALGAGRMFGMIQPDPPRCRRRPGRRSTGWAAWAGSPPSARRRTGAT